MSSNVMSLSNSNINSNNEISVGAVLSRKMGIGCLDNFPMKKKLNMSTHRIE